MRARTHGPFLLLATTLAAASGGCDGVIGDGDAPNGPTVTPTAECSPTADPIRRLTPTEYVNTATTLFPGVVLPTASPIPDSRVHGFTNQSAGQSISDLGVQRYEELAVAIGEAAAQQLDSWAPCSDDSDACAESLAKELAFRAYRRPLA
ncbi:MAG: DUF1587 domain-containing protein, partial [Myxococcales bacterium]|nr:DUF1587 domain-containing protein [Myxococcales bacterium]